jgi:sphinganine-1-phosphate aldolase
VTIPSHGRSTADVLADLDASTANDVRWRDGRSFTLAYNAGAEVLDLQREAYGRFIQENALNVEAFPSLRVLQNDVIASVCELLDGGPDACGFMTSGGTESILMAVRAAANRARTERGITAPEMVLPTSAHAAFEKAADYFSVKSVRVGVRDDWRADVDAMRAAVNDNTVLIVGSAPQYPQGVVDDIESIAAIAAERSINCHVDACMGGVTLSYLKRLGHELPKWNLSVPGVSSVSVDLHKFGYTAKGASVIAWSNKHLRRHQTFITDNWLGGFYGSSGVLGTKSGGPIAAAWAVMQHLGHDGYERVTAQAKRAADSLATGIESIDGLALRTKPDATLLSFGSTDPAVSIFGVADALWERGWFMDRQTPPDSLHLTVNAVHEAVVDDFLADLRACLEIVRSTAQTGSVGAYGTTE